MANWRFYSLGGEWLGAPDGVSVHGAGVENPVPAFNVRQLGAQPPNGCERSGLFAEP